MRVVVRALAALSLALTVALALAACGGSGKHASTTVAGVAAPPGGAEPGASSAGDVPPGGATTPAGSGAGNAGAKGGASAHNGAAGTGGAGAVGGDGNTKHGAGRSGSTGGSAPRSARAHHGRGVTGSHGAGTTSTGTAGGTGSGASLGGESGGDGGGGGGGGEEALYAVHSLNMEPTYPPNTTVAYDPTHTTPHVGDVVVFRLPLNALEEGCGDNPPPLHACQESAPGLSTTQALGRIVGVAGDSLAFDEGNVILNGALQHESSLKPCGNGPVCTFTRPIVVPGDDYYILYDNRAMLDDSRVWGAIPQAAIVGTVTGTR